MTAAATGNRERPVSEPDPSRPEEEARRSFASRPILCCLPPFFSLRFVCVPITSDLLLIGTCTLSQTISEKNVPGTGKILGFLVVVMLLRIRYF
jgi:hypothetical protein